MVFNILKKNFKEHSHQSKDAIKKMQYQHRKDLIQPRVGGEINPAYLENYGTKNLNISDHDAKQMGKKGKYQHLKVLDNARRANEKKAKN